MNTESGISFVTQMAKLGLKTADKLFSLRALIMAFEKLRKRWEREERDRKDLALRLRESLNEKGIPVFQKYNLKEVYLFGSVLKGRCFQSSDVDLYVSPLKADRYWQCLADLSETLGTRVDLYTQSDDPVFIEKIRVRGEQIYEA